MENLTIATNLSAVAVPVELISPLKVWGPVKVLVAVEALALNSPQSPIVK
jgi:hypothetical protein